MFRIHNRQIFNGTVDNTTTTSDFEDISFIYGFSVIATLAGAGATGTIKLEASNDGETWADISGTSQAIAGPGTYNQNLTDMFYKYVRLSVEETGGGPTTVTAQINTKGI